MNIAQGLENLKLEQDAVALYDALASIEREPRRAAAFRHIAANERRHVDLWAARLRELGATVPPPARPRARVRFIILGARLLGTKAVAELMKTFEGDELELYEAQEASDDIRAVADDEREHAQIWERLGGDGGSAAAVPLVSAGGQAAAPEGATPGAGAVARREGWHRTARSGTLRAVIFGVSDGLVSNLSLVMGVAGASTTGDFILLAGVAGLLAGAFSMAAGEYISMQSQRELFERQIELERAQLEAMPAEAERELVEIYMAKGLPREDARRVASRLFRDPESALDTLVREELGLDPDELGSPWGASLGSFLAFALGAVIPVVPYLFGNGTAAFVASLGFSLAALFAVGAAVSLLTGKGVVFSGLRQVGIGAAAAAVTYAIGTIIGVGVAGVSAGELADRLRADGLAPGAWSNGPGDRYSPHGHDYDKVLVCAEGSIRFGLPDRGITVDLGVGDRLDLPAGTRHDAFVGPDGVTCLEAHVPAGTLPEVRRHPAGGW